MSHLVRVSDQTYAKMCKEKPPGMTQGQYFDLLVENQSGSAKGCLRKIAKDFGDAF